jgi:integrase
LLERWLVTDITASDIARYQKTRLAEDASAKTVNLEVGTIRSILRRNRVWAEIQPDVKMLPTRDDVGKALSGDEEEALLRCCSGSRSRTLYPAVVLALNTGMRYSEIRLLQWKQIDLRGRTLLVGKSKTESGTGRTIPLNRRILAVMEMWASHFPDRKPEHYVFPSEKYGAGTDSFKPCVYGTDVTKPINDWKEAWEGAKRRAAVVVTQQSRDTAATKMQETGNLQLQCRFHDLRHTACTRLLEGGVPYPIVATIMGWSASTAIRMAKRYGHIGQRAMRQAMEVLEVVETHVGSPKNPPKSESDETERFN